MSLTENLIKEYKNQVGKMTLIPGDGGRFEVTIGKDLVFSKLKEGRFPEYPEIKKAVDARLRK